MSEKHHKISEHSDPASNEDPTGGYLEPISNEDYAGWILQYMNYGKFLATNLDSKDPQEVVIQSSHMLNYLDSQWVRFQNPKRGEGGGCWQHTFILASVAGSTLHDERSPLEESSFKIETELNDEGVALAPRRHPNTYGFINDSFKDGEMREEIADAIKQPPQKYSSADLKEVHKKVVRNAETKKNVLSASSMILSYEVGRMLDDSLESLVAEKGVGQYDSILGFVIDFMGDRPGDIEEQAVDQGFGHKYPNVDSATGHFAVFDVYVAPEHTGSITVKSSHDYTMPDGSAYRLSVLVSEDIDVAWSELEDLEGATVGTRRGMPSEVIVQKELIETGVIDDYKETPPYEPHVRKFAYKLENGGIDAIILNAPLAEKLANDDARAVEVAFTHEIGEKYKKDVIWEIKFDSTPEPKNKSEIELDPSEYFSASPLKQDDDVLDPPPTWPRTSQTNVPVKLWQKGQPRHEFKVYPEIPVRGRTATLDALDTEDPDLGSGIESYDWKIVSEHNNNKSYETTLSGEIVNHSFETSGTYTVILTITYATGATSSYTKKIAVTNPPEAVLDIDHEKAGEGQSITFDGSESDDPDGDDLTYTWTFYKMVNGEPIRINNIDNEQSVETSFENTGTYKVELEVTDSVGAKDTIQEFFEIVENKPPKAVLNVDSKEAEENQSITFDGSESEDPDGDDLMYTWTFYKMDSGGIAAPILDIDNELIVETSFEEVGAYTVELEVIDAIGEKDTAQKSFDVIEKDCPPPSAEITGPETVEPGEQATWDGSNSEGEIVSYTWRETAVTDEYLGSDPEITAAFESPPGGEPGGRTIKLEVEDECGQTDSTTHSVSTLTCPEPSAEIRGPTSVKAGEEAIWKGYYSEGEGLNYTWRDPDTGEKIGEDSSLVKTFSSVGDHTIALEVKDLCQQTDSTTQSVVVCSEPSAEISGPAVVEAGKQETWSADDSKGEDLSYTWSGPGISGTSPKYGSEITETFHSASVIELEVRDECGQTATTKFPVHVAEPPSADIDGPTSVTVDEQATWDASDSTGVGLSYSWNGDVSGNDPKVTETFSSEGERDIELEVENQYGLTDEATKTVEVEKSCPPPSAEISGPTTVEAGKKETWHANNSEGEKLSYTWKETAFGEYLGSGEKVTERFESPQFGAPSGRTIALEVEDRCGQTDTDTLQVIVE